MASVRIPIISSENYKVELHDEEEESTRDINSDENEENIPYHAREHALPFTYGNLPPNFKKSDLNHVVIEEVGETSSKTGRPPVSPSMARKSNRPAIQTSLPVLRKTPSRQEFEEMLLERREQSLREQNNTATKLAQEAAIQKDLDELQEVLNKKHLKQQQKLQQQLQRQQQLEQQLQQQQLEQQRQQQLQRQLQERPKQNASVEFESRINSAKPTECTDIVKYVETIDLPDAKKNDQKRPIAEKSFNVIAALEMPEPRRSETPNFPVTSKTSLDDRCVSPYSADVPSSPTMKRSVPNRSNESITSNEISSKTSTHRAVSNEPQEVDPHLVKFAKDSSEFWYKPHLTREEAVALLRNAATGTFLIRNSTTYKNAFGLVLRVAKPPPGVYIPEDSHNNDVLVRHFLLEPTTRGVRLKGCSNEPTFTSLSALVYQHSIDQLALPCKLIIPDRDLLQSFGDPDLMAAQKQLLNQGAACNVLYLFTWNTESLTGDEAIRKAVSEMYSYSSLPQVVEVHLKVSQQGITLTDNTRRLFFRRHYAAQNISHFGLDPGNRFWSVAANDEGVQRPVNKTIFAFIARTPTGARDNECHVFCDLAASQPSSAIVSFANKVLPINKENNTII